MIEIRQVKTDSPEYRFVERLLVEAFPVDERRDLPLQRAVTDGRDGFRCCVLTADGRPVGLLNYWDFPAFRYVEHFALDPSERNRGYGAEAIRHFIAMSDKPVVLEVEMPEDELTRRRVGFYSRNGLRLWADADYIQPPYRPGGNSLPMRIMATADLPAAAFPEVRDTLHREVYGTI